MTKTRSARLSKKGQFVRVMLTRPQEYARTTRGLLKGTWGRSRRAVERSIERERRSWQ